MKAFEVFAIYVAPFLIIGAAIKLFMKRYAVDLPDVQKNAGSKQSADLCSELGVQTNKASFGLMASCISNVAYWHKTDLSVYLGDVCSWE
jgi:hypothetical protein